MEDPSSMGEGSGWDNGTSSVTRVGDAGMQSVSMVLRGSQRDCVIVTHGSAEPKSTCLSVCRVSLPQFPQVPLLLPGVTSHHPACKPSCQALLSRVNLG